MKNKISVRVASLILLGAILLSACTQSYSPAPLTTPTLIPTGLFVVSPFPSGQDPMQLVADLGTQTALAKTAEAVGGTPGTPSTMTTPSTPSTSSLPGGTMITPQSVTPQTPSAGTTTVPVVTTPAPVTVVPGATTAVPSTVVVPTISSVNPNTYALKNGEWPVCIARRFNVDPTALMAASGLSGADATTLMPGTVLTIPKTGSFSGPRAWHSHPDTYTVGSSNETLNYVACYYGDIYPESIAKANSLSMNAVLTAGQKLSIP